MSGCVKGLTGFLVTACGVWQGWGVGEREMGVHLYHIA